MARVDLIDELIKKYPKEAEIAARRAFNEALRWYKAQVSRYASQQLNIPKKALKSRWFANKSEHSMWLGINDIAVHRLGKYAITKDGVKVGKETYQGAFVWRGVVFERVGNKRLPIEKVTKEVSDGLIVAFEKYKQPAIKRFRDKFESEFNYERSK